MANAFRINTNIQSQQAFQNLSETNDQLSELRERLTTGKRINEASDDAAGFQIANQLEAKTGAQGVALRNIGDAKSMLSTAEGALSSQLNILQTAKEKATQAANGSLAQEQRNAIANELKALGNEIDDIAGNATFNGKQLLTQGTSTEDGDSASQFTFQTGSESDNTFSTKLKDSKTDDLGVGGDIDLSSNPSEGKTVDSGDFSSKPATTGNVSIGTSGGDLAGDLDGGTFEVKVSENGNTTDNKLEFQVGDSERTQTADVSAATSKITLEADGSGNKIQVDVGAGSISQGDVAEGKTKTFEVNVTGTKNMGERLKGGSAEVARNIMDDIDSAIDRVTKELSDVGASQNRLSFKKSNLETTQTNLKAAQSRIEDADFAQTQTQVAKLQVQQQSGTAQLAQANAAGQSVLSLLQG